MEQIELIEPRKTYADDIWKFRQEILECDAKMKINLQAANHLIYVCLLKSG